MRSLYFFAVRSHGEVFAVDPKTLEMYRLATVAEGGYKVELTSPRALGLPGGLYKARRAVAWELEGVRLALQTLFGQPVRALTTQAPSYVVHHIAGEYVDLNTELFILKDTYARKAREKRYKKKARREANRTTLDAREALGYRIHNEEE